MYLIETNMYIWIHTYIRSRMAAPNSQQLVIGYLDKHYQTWTGNNQNFSFTSTVFESPGLLITQNDFHDLEFVYFFKL